MFLKRSKYAGLLSDEQCEENNKIYVEKRKLSFYFCYADYQGLTLIFVSLLVCILFASTTLGLFLNAKSGCQESNCVFENGTNGGCLVHTLVNNTIENECFMPTTLCPFVNQTTCYFDLDDGGCYSFLCYNHTFLMTGSLSGFAFMISLAASAYALFKFCTKSHTLNKLSEPKLVFES